jgi:DNA-binding transcriptional MerR regulator
MSFSISEASELTGLPAHTLRFWEKEFPELCPQKNNVGVRKYLRDDIELILKIKELVHHKKFTIKGAKTALLKANKEDDPTLEHKLEAKIMEKNKKIEKLEKEIFYIKTDIIKLINYLNE